MVSDAIPGVHGGLSDRISLLYVDDEPALLDVAKEYLERSNEFTVETTRFAGNVLDLLGERAYDGVISDYQMPEMDGIELLKQIRSRYPDLPFILFTGKGRETVVIQAIDAGADYYVQKGGEPRSQFRELIHKIRLAVEKRYVQQALIAGEERYRNIVEGQTEFICRFLPDGTHNFVNDAYCRYFGMPREAIVGSRYSPRMPDEDAALVRAHLASLTPDHPAGTIEHQIYMPDGSVRWHQWTDRAIYDDEGGLAGYQSTGRDITDRKTAELELQKKNEELCAAYEQLSATEEALRSSYFDLEKSQRTLEDRDLTLDAIIHESPIPQFVIDRNHRIVHWNHALALYSGIPAGEVTGTDQHWMAFYPVQRPCLADLLVDDAPDEIPLWYPNRYTTSTLISGAVEATDFFPHMGLNGKWLHFTAGVIKDRHGNIIGAVETLEDITESKLKEIELVRKHEELNASYEQLAAAEDEMRMNYDELLALKAELHDHREPGPRAVASPGEFVRRTHPDGIHFFVNEAYCRYLNMPGEEITGHRTRPKIPKGASTHLVRHLRSLTPEEPEATIDHPVVMPDGSVRWQRWINRAIYDRNGSLLEYHSVGRDITANRRTGETPRPGGEHDPSFMGRYSNRK
jgi:PAS domain S-box-containing protein